MFSKGKVMGVTSAGFGFSSAIFSPLQTAIINPGLKKSSKFYCFNEYIKLIEKGFVNTIPSLKMIFR